MDKIEPNPEIFLKEYGLNFDWMTSNWTKNSIIMAMQQYAKEYHFYCTDKPQNNHDLIKELINMHEHPENSNDKWKQEILITAKEVIK